MGRQVAVVLYGVAMVAVIVGVDLAFFRIFVLFGALVAVWAGGAWSLDEFVLSR
jgi:hypothetical protein